MSVRKYKMIPLNSYDKNDIFPLTYLNGGGHTKTFDRDILELDIKE